MNGISLALRMARRELRDGVARFGVFLTCLALGVAAVVTVGEVAAMVDYALRADAKSIMGGDISVTRSHLELDRDALDWLAAQGEVTHFVRLRTMARAERPRPDAQRSMLVELKAVEAGYPLYGEVVTRPDAPLQQALREGPKGVWGAVADERVLLRLGLELGDILLVGKARFRINGVLVHEPDKAAQFFGLGPRLFVSAQSLPATGLLVPGTVVYHVYKLRLADAPAGGARSGERRIKAIVETFHERFGHTGARVRDYTESGDRLRHFMDTMQRYLLLVGLISLLVGGIGVANGVRSYLETKSATIATMKCLGAERRTVVSIYLAQVVYLAVLGSAGGIVAGLATARVAVHFLFMTLGFNMAPGAAFTHGLALTPVAGGLGFGLLTALFFALWPLARAGNVSPAQLFRGYAGWRPHRHSALTFVAALLILACMLLLAWGMTRDGVLVAGFAGGTMAGAVVFRLAAWGFMVAAAKAPRPRHLWLRQALANLHRPGARTADVVFSLGLGLSALASVALIDGNMQRQINEQMPSQAPSYFFIDIPKQDIDGFRDALLALPSVTRFESEPSLRGRIVRINGAPVDKVEVAPDAQWAVRSERGLTFAGAKPEKVKIVAGEWWPPDYSGPPLMCFTKGLADGFGVGVGDTLTVNVLGREITATIACLREVDWTTLALNHAVMFGPGVLENAPYSHIATVYETEEPEGANRDAVFTTVVKRFPEVTAVYIKDVLRDVGSIFDAIGLAVRSTAAVTLLAGLLVLAETLRATLRGRYYEAVLFKVLGATRWDIVRTLMAEFFLLGAGTALLAAILGSVVSFVFITMVMKSGWTLLAAPLVLVCLGGILATLSLGMLGVRGVLGRKAWPVLRNE